MTKRKQTKTKSPKSRSPHINAQLARQNYSNQNSALGDIGQIAGNAFSKFFGWGAYKEIKQNSLIDTTTGQQVPFMHSTDDSFRFTNREYIGDISANGNVFTARTFPVNPGMEVTFPFVSTIANNFSQYRFDGLIFEFKSTSATALVNGTNTAMGSVILVANYNANEPPSTTKAQALNSMWSVDGKPSDDIILPIECAPDETTVPNKYVRDTGVTGDLRLNDLANVSVHTAGFPGANVIGELWVSYDVVFMKPILSDKGGLIRTDHYIQVGNAAGTQIFGTIAQSRINGIGTVCDVNTMTFPLGTVGEFGVTVFVAGGAAAVAGTIALTPTNCTIIASMTNANYQGLQAPSGAAATTNYAAAWQVSITDSSVAASVVVTPITFPTNASIDILVSELDGSYN
jgi:hypothetical protein